MSDWAGLWLGCGIAFAAYAISEAIEFKAMREKEARIHDTNSNERIRTYAIDKEFGK